MDSELKRQLDEFCDTVGMNSSTAFSLFAYAVVSEQRIPFEIKTYHIDKEDLMRRDEDLRAGRNIVKKTWSELKDMEND